MSFLIVLWMQFSAHGLKVIVDPGHGGRDQGAVRQGVLESEITLQVALKLQKLLEKDGRFQVHLTRRNNRGLTLSQRAQVAKDKKADVFVSIHVNSSPDQKAKGAEFYFQNQLPSDQESMLLAHRENSADETSAKAQPYAFLAQNKYPTEVATIVTDLLDSDRVWRSSHLSRALKTNWKGSRKSQQNSIRQAPFFVLSEISTPSTLIELGFLTNPEDLADLTDPSKQDRMAQDLYRGLIAYKESMDK